MLIKPVTIISPFSREPNNAKNYPFWGPLCNGLHAKGWNVIQIGTPGEHQICGDFRTGLTLPEIEKLLLDVGHFIAIDNFLHHMAYHLGVKGVTLWGPSDPLIFGYPTQQNIIKSREFLREDQLGFYKGWEWKHKQGGWYEAEEVLRKICSGALNQGSGSSK